MNGPLDMASVVLHEGSAVNDDRPLVGQMGFAAFRDLLGQVIGINDFDVGKLFGGGRHGAANPTGGT